MTTSAAGVVLAAAALLATAPPAPAPAAPDPGPLFPVQKDGKWGYIDRAGRLVIPPRFDAAGRFSEGLAPVELEGKRGYADASGALVLVPPQAPADPGSLHRRFSDGLAPVREGTKLGYIDRTGALAIPARFTVAEDFSEGLAFACDLLGCGYVDRSGQGVLGPGFLGGTPFRNGLAAIWIGKGDMGAKRYRLYDRKRGWLAGDYEDAKSLSEDLLAVKSSNRWGFVDRTGRGVIAPQFAWASDFSEGLAPAAQWVWSCGYVARSGELVVPSKLRTCGPFSNGLARVDLSAANEDAKTLKIAFIDPAGRVVIDAAAASPPFDDAEDFRDGLAAVHVKGESGGSRLGYIDTSGRYVWAPTE